MLHNTTIYRKRGPDLSVTPYKSTDTIGKDVLRFDADSVLRFHQKHVVEFSKGQTSAS